MHVKHGELNTKPDQSKDVPVALKKKNIPVNLISWSIVRHSCGCSCIFFKETLWMHLYCENVLSFWALAANWSTRSSSSRSIFERDWAGFISGYCAWALLVLLGLLNFVLCHKPYTWTPENPAFLVLLNNKRNFKPFRFIGFYFLSLREYHWMHPLTQFTHTTTRNPLCMRLWKHQTHLGCGHVD